MALVSPANAGDEKAERASPKPVVFGLVWNEMP
jgi:hypothetical protein